MLKETVKELSKEEKEKQKEKNRKKTIKKLKKIAKIKILDDVFDKMLFKAEKTKVKDEE